MLYPDLLGPDFESLPRALREFHSNPRGGRATGTVSVRHANRLLALLAGFPAAGDNIPMALDVTVAGNGEIWKRSFGGAIRQSTQRRVDGLLEETAGPVRIFFQVFTDRGTLRLESRRARFWIVPLPLRVTAQARGDDTSWTFEVAISLVGSYSGAMVSLP